MDKKQKRPVAATILVILMIFQGLSGILGGMGLILDPTGKSLQIPLEWLEGSPFRDYLIPGWILLLVLGILPLIVAAGLLRRQALSWSAALMVGIALLIWIAVEVIIIGYHPDPPLQFIYGTVGLLILIFVMLPAVRRYYLLPRKQ